MECNIPVPTGYKKMVTSSLYANSKSSGMITLLKSSHPLVFFLFTILLFQNCQSDRKQGAGSREQDLSKIVVLTFDDAVKSHHSFVAPLLKDLGFDATFFITYEWMDDTVNFMSWQEVGELHTMGFEIGNHSWHHWDFSSLKQLPCWKVNWA
jgi:peptidoglycan/xylan/chitin deacetylase (PgdA/CDA1 family)